MVIQKICNSLTVTKHFRVISATFYRLLRDHVNVMHYLDVTIPFNEKFPWYVCVYRSWCSIPRNAQTTFKHNGIILTDPAAANSYTKTFILNELAIISNK